MTSSGLPVVGRVETRDFDRLNDRPVVERAPVVELVETHNPIPRRTP